VILDKSAANPRALRKACFRPNDSEHPIGAQILGRTPATMTRAARDLVSTGYDLIDINVACPAPKVLRRQRGGALLEEPSRVIEIVKAVRDAVTCPLLMKLRIGVNHQPESRDSFWEIVNRSITHGVDALVIHGRTVTEKYRGKADWQILAECKRRFPRAVIIGSGDIFDAQESMMRLSQSGLDGLVVARGAVGNPWIYRDLRAICQGCPLPPAPDLAEQKQVMIQHLEWIRLGFKEKRAVGYFRKFLVGYTKHHPQRKRVLLDLMGAQTQQKVVDKIEQWYH
jgi:nifR3 family TIM-barrel protein